MFNLPGPFYSLYWQKAADRTWRELGFYSYRMNYEVTKGNLMSYHDISLIKNLIVQNPLGWSVTLNVLGLDAFYLEKWQLFVQRHLLGLESLGKDGWTRQSFSKSLGCKFLANMGRRMEGKQWKAEIFLRILIHLAYFVLLHTNVYMRRVVGHPTWLNGFLDTLAMI